GTLASFKSTLTLPGMAGIVLTFGMAVDANVLNFERIRAELRNGKGLRAAIADGYKGAYSSIIDGNVTTILTAIILMVFGAGPVKGFAVTLFFGIITSLFSAIFVTRLIFEFLLDKKQNIQFWTGFTKDAFTNINFDFLGNRKKFYVISSVIVAICVGSIIFRGFNYGVDLQGGRTYTVAFDNTNFDAQKIAEAVAVEFEGNEPQVKLFGGNDRVKIISKYLNENTDPAKEEELKERLYNSVKPFFNDAPSFEVFKNEANGIGLTGAEKVGPSIAGDTRDQSFFAVLASLIIMFIYIMVRFKGPSFGLGAVVGLIHNVIVVLGVFSLFNGILPFALEVDQAIIAAVLTVI